jgi:hypothetical protein
VVKLTDLVGLLLGIVFPAGNVIRSGWSDREVKTRLESDLEHGAALGIAACYVNVTQRRGLDNAKLLGMGLFHDVHEAITSDLSPSQIYPMGRTRRAREKFWERIGGRIDWLRWEVLSRDSDRKAMWKLTRPMDGQARNLFRQWWAEFYAGKSPEAQLLRQLHPIVDCAKGVAYQMSPENRRMHSINTFFEEARVVTTDPRLRELLSELETLRQSGPGGLTH